MNKRIEQIAAQAKKVIGHTDGGYTEITSLDPEKFAELIINEFAKQVQVEADWFELEQLLIRLVCENAKEHFGVKE